jgi:hypothetical protein
MPSRNPRRHAARCASLLRCRSVSPMWCRSCRVSDRVPGSDDRSPSRRRNCRPRRRRVRHGAADCRFAGFPADCATAVPGSATRRRCASVFRSAGPPDPSGRARQPRLSRLRLPALARDLALCPPRGRRSGGNPARPAARQQCRCTRAGAAGGARSSGPTRIHGRISRPAGSSRYWPDGPCRLWRCTWLRRLADYARRASAFSSTFLCIGWRPRLGRNSPSISAQFCAAKFPLIFGCYVRLNSLIRCQIRLIRRATNF